MQRFLVLLAAALVSATPLSAQFAPVTKARLVLAAETAQPGQTVLAGVHLQMPRKWHTYWRNAGESGDATKIEWTLPAGVTAGDIQWPLPERYTLLDFTTYVYHDEVVLLVPLMLAADLKPGPLEVAAKVSWLECEETCVPGSADVKATLVVGNETRPFADAALIDRFRQKVPRPDPAFAVTARWERAGTDNTRPFLIELPATSDFTEADFYPFLHEHFEVSPAAEKVAAPAGRLAVRKHVKKFDGGWPKEVAGLIVNKFGDGQPTRAVEVRLALEESAPGFAGAAGGGKRSLGWMLLFAFLGGLILNVMPCVLPVIALKVLGFVQQSRESPQRVRMLSLVFLAGVVVSFLVLAGLVIGVQQAGNLASWGMQFGNPYFVVGMTVLVTLVALNLFGLFEVTLGGGTLGAAAELAGREGAAGAFFNGALVTALATPCTAPFLGAALGFAFTQPPAIIVLMFTTVALGLAAPYVVLSWEPKWLKFLPRPGAWMEKFKMAMGFPMLAVAIWLLSISGRHFGTEGILWIGLFLLVLALAAWVWGEFVQRGRSHTGLAAAISVALLVVGYVSTLERQLNWRAPVKVAASVPGAARSGGIEWQPWTPAAVAEARAAGRPVFVDFTADWCLTCQVNKKTSIEIPSVAAKLKEVNAVPLLGDFTLTPPDIAAELKRYGRAGVPLVLVFPPDPGADPIVLPELLTPSIVLDALDRAAPKKVAGGR